MNLEFKLLVISAYVLAAGALILGEGFHGLLVLFWITALSIVPMIRRYQYLAARK
jgi:hypothetical protein